jgi:chromosomal replication initiation ATPase DnaA
MNNISVQTIDSIMFSLKIKFIEELEKNGIKIIERMPYDVFIKKVYDKYKVNDEILLKNDRKTHYKMISFAITYVLRNFYKMNFRQIGLHFQGKNHGTYISRYYAAKNWLDTKDPLFEGYYQDITNLLSNN